jgi:hypothetical protein
MDLVSPERADTDVAPAALTDLAASAADTQNSDLGIEASGSTLGARYAAEIAAAKAAQRAAMSAWLQELHNQGLVFSD